MLWGIGCHSQSATLVIIIQFGWARALGWVGGREAYQIASIHSLQHHYECFNASKHCHAGLSAGSRQGGSEK